MGINWFELGWIVVFTLFGVFLAGLVIIEVINRIRMFIEWYDYKAQIRAIEKLGKNMQHGWYWFKPEEADMMKAVGRYLEHSGSHVIIDYHVLRDTYLAKVKQDRIEQEKIDYDRAQLARLLNEGDENAKVPKEASSN